jgi:TM2 domain-containing membrane protein YozV
MRQAERRVDIEESAMKCAVHADAEATGFCRHCGKAMCPVCVRPVRDVLYCEDCLATVMGVSNPASAPASAPGTAPVAAVGVPAATPTGLGPSPLLAFFLGFLPGLGAFYNEQFGKGIIHLALFLFLFILGVDGAVSGGAEAALWICVSALWVYMPIDAYRTAKARLAGAALSDPLENFSKGRPVGPILIIGVGILLLLHNFDWFPWWRVQQFWPVILIVVGVLMFRNRLGGR